MQKSPKFSFNLDEINEKAVLFVDGESYRIHYDLDAIEMFYQVFGINPVIEGIGLGPVRLAVLLWCGLLRHRPTIEADTVKAWFTPRTMAQLGDGTARAWSLFLPKPSREGAKADPRAAGQVQTGGDTTGALHDTILASPASNSAN